MISGTRPLRFGGFELDVQSGKLCKHGRRIRTPSQSLQVLRFLLDRPGEVVEREELYRKLWSNDVSVDFEHSLNAAVRKLRRSLRDSAGKPKYIETIPRRGYRFIGKLEQLELPPQGGDFVEADHVQVNGEIVGDGLFSNTKTPEATLASASNISRGRTILARGVTVAAFVALAGMPFIFHPGWGRHHSRFDRISITPVTATGKVTGAAISPDGRYVVYAASDAGRESLRMRQLATGTEAEMIPLADLNYRKLAFSPDNNLIYYVKDESGRPPTLHSRPVLGGVEIKILENVPSFGNLSPDGRSFVFIRNLPSGESALIVANVDGSGERKLAIRHHPAFFGASASPRRTGVPDWQAAGPAWSPDGKTIACPAGDFRGFIGYIVTVPANGGTERILTRQKWYSVQTLGWLHSEDLIAQVNEEIDAPHQLRYISYPDGEVRNVTSDLNNYRSVSLSADSSALVTLQRTTVSDLWIVRVGKTADARKIGPSTPIGPRKNVMSWTPDGHVVYVSRAAGKMDIWIAESDGRNPRQLTQSGKYNLQPRVCPDGRYIVFSSDRSGKLNIWRMNIDGSNGKQLTFGDAESRPDCSPDGRWVYYTSHAAVPKSIWKVPLDGGAPVRLIDQWSVSPAVSPDGKWVAFNYWEDQFPGPSVAIMPTDARTRPKVFDFDADFVRWTRDSRSLLYNRRDRGVDDIWRQPIDGGRPERLTDFKAGLIWNFDWSPSGKQLVCARGYEHSDVVLIREPR